MSHPGLDTLVLWGDCKIGDRKIMSDALVIRKYMFKMYPLAAQSAAILEQSRMVAQLWNAFLQRREDVYRRERRTLSAYEMYPEISALRRELPEWKENSSVTCQKVTFLLEEAFKAFFKRAKRGDGAASGYPRYKRTSDGMSIPFGQVRKGGWDFQHIDGKRWRVYVFGISKVKDRSTWIKVRGKFPEEAVDIRTAEIVHRDGSWWLSVAVKMSPRRDHGDDVVTVKMNLLDKFARVERAKGEYLARSKEQIATHSQQHVATSGSDTGNLGGDDRSPATTPPCCGGLDTGNLSQENVTNEMRSIMRLEERADNIASVRDTRFKKFSWRWRRETRRIAGLRAKAKRRRKHILHAWTTALVSDACDITVVMPSVKESTVSPRGDEREWGAAVEPVSALNRHVLNQAPALAFQLMAYKAKEAGIRCDIVIDKAPNIAIGEKLVAASKSVRKAKRALKR